ncbi:hypothetical protein [Capybara microvirus Cap3_SP_315]|nr:hypothetical protein [Capybara microvirus Cap3_SP_315]
MSFKKLIDFQLPKVDDPSILVHEDIEGTNFSRLVEKPLSSIHVDLPDFRLVSLSEILSRGEDLQKVDTKLFESNLPDFDNDIEQIVNTYES